MNQAINTINGNHKEHDKYGQHTYRAITTFYERKMS